MANTLLAAMQTSDSHTENGCVTNSTSLNNCVDLFFQIGAMRGQDKSRLLTAFAKAFGENPLTALKLIFWARDVRGGAGERQIFRDIASYLAEKRPSVMAKNLSLVTEFGRWDDLLVFIGTTLEKQALDLIAKGLSENNGLCAKWMPRPNVKNREKKRWATALRTHLRLTPKEYSKLLVENSNTVEQLMCAKEWSAIEYSKLPSKAMSSYMKAFSKQDNERFGQYLTSLEKGEVKINAGALYPYDIIMNMKHGNSRGADAQWLALPNFMGNGEERILPLVDVSSSMDQPVGDNANLNVLDVAISLGLYICERNIGAFHNAFVTFHDHSDLITVNGSLTERYNQMKRSPWGGSTNLERAFREILAKAKAGNVPAYEMPTMFIIFSDMEFNVADRRWSDTAQQMIEREFAAAGYTMPKIVYWNLASRGDKNKPVHFDKAGTALVSGFSPSLLTSLLSGEDTSPYAMMMTVVDSERYSRVTV